MKPFSYIFYNYFYKYLLRLYLKTDSHVRFEGFQLKVFKEVFHPKLFFSTTYFYSFLKEKNFEGKTFLEIGAGSGILSLLAYSKGAAVTAIDIDPKAVENTRLNFSKNFQKTDHIKVIESDLFRDLPAQVFDAIVINPPYYFKKVKVNAHYAWYCGENGEYFEKLFEGLRRYMHAASEVYMVLEQNSEIDRIKRMAADKAITFTKVDERLVKWEKSFIFRLSF